MIDKERLKNQEIKGRNTKGNNKAVLLGRFDRRCSAHAANEGVQNKNENENVPGTSSETERNLAVSQVTPHSRTTSTSR
jgi:uncharacterized protein YpmB